MVALLVCVSCADGQRPVDDDTVLNYLDRAAACHRDIAAIEASRARPKEYLFADNLRDSGAQALRSAFPGTWQRPQTASPGNWPLLLKVNRG